MEKKTQIRKAMNASKVSRALASGSYTLFEQLDFLFCEGVYEFDLALQILDSFIVAQFQSIQRLYFCLRIVELLCQTIHLFFILHHQRCVQFLLLFDVLVCLR